MSNKPLVSVIIPTKDSEKQLRECLEGINKQTHKNVEIIISDGLSKDNTLKIAKEYKTRIEINKKIFAEPGVSLGFKNAKGEILIVLAVDNIFKENNAIETIVKVFNNKTVFAAFPKHDSTRNDSLFTKYINVFTDPFNHFVYGYAANARTFNKVYKTIVHNSIFDIYDFRSSKVKPILAVAQGFSVRKEFIDKKRNEMDDITPVLDLINEGKYIAYLHSVHLYHHTVNSLEQFIRKQRWSAKNALSGKEYGISLRISSLTREQKLRMYLFPVYSITIILPLLRSFYYLVKDNESMWLFHPYISFISGLAITFEYAKIKLGLSKTISRL